MIAAVDFLNSRLMMACIHSLDWVIFFHFQEGFMLRPLGKIKLFTSLKPLFALVDLSLKQEGTNLDTWISTLRE